MEKGVGVWWSSHRHGSASCVHNPSPLSSTPAAGRSARHLDTRPPRPHVTTHQVASAASHPQLGLLHLPSRSRRSPPAHSTHPTPHRIVHPTVLTPGTPRPSRHNANPPLQRHATPSRLVGFDITLSTHQPASPTPLHRTPPRRPQATHRCELNSPCQAATAPPTALNGSSSSARSSSRTRTTASTARVRGLVWLQGENCVCGRGEGVRGL